MWHGRYSVDSSWIGVLLILEGGGGAIIALYLPSLILDGHWPHIKRLLGGVVEVIGDG